MVWGSLPIFFRLSHPSIATPTDVFPGTAVWYAVPHMTVGYSGAVFNSECCERSFCQAHNLQNKCKKITLTVHF